LGGPIPQGDIREFAGLRLNAAPEFAGVWRLIVIDGRFGRDELSYAFDGGAASHSVLDLFI